MSLPYLGDSGFYIISDTILCDGTGALMLLLKSFKKKVSFISDPGNFSHFNAIFKKFGIQLNYFELETNIELGDLPLTENPPVTWLDAPRRLAIKDICKTLQKTSQEVIAFDDIFSVLIELGLEETVNLLFLLKSLAKVVVIKGNSEVISQLWMIEQISKGSITLSLLKSGISTEYQGRVKVEYREKIIKLEVGLFYYKISNDNFILIE